MIGLMKINPFILLLAIALACAGCADAEKPESTDGAGVMVSWKFEDKQYSSYSALDQRDSAIAVLVKKDDGSNALLLLDANSGSRRWETEIPGWPSIRPPIIGDSVVCAISQDPPGNYILNAYELTSGRKVWQRDVGFSPSSNPAAFSRPLFWDGKIGLISDAGDVIALEEKTGKVSWRARLPTDIGWPPPIATSGKLLFHWEAHPLESKWGKGVDCLNATDGNLVWRYVSPAKPGTRSVSQATGDYLLLGEYQPPDRSDPDAESPKALTVTCLDVDDGAVVWTADLPMAFFLIASEGKLTGLVPKLYDAQIVTETPHLYVVDITNPEVPPADVMNTPIPPLDTFWGSLLGSQRNSAVLLTNPGILKSEQAPAIIWLDTTSGDILTRWKLPSGQTFDYGTTDVGSEKVYVAVLHDGVYALEQAD